MEKKDTTHRNETAYPDTYRLTKIFARENRNVQTEAESFLWEHIRRKALGVKFRRQHIIGDYIADFLCIDKKLIVEVDGGYHTTPQQRNEDLVRSEWLYQQGYVVLRFTNETVLNDIEYVVGRIREIIDKM